MSNLWDTWSERNLDDIRPSSSQVLKCSSPKKNSLIIRTKEKSAVSSSDKKGKGRPASTGMHKVVHNQAPVETKMFINETLQGITTQCENLNVNSESDDAVTAESTVPTKKMKNAKKKQRLKEQIQEQNTQSQQTPAPAQQMPQLPQPLLSFPNMQHNVVQHQLSQTFSVQELFMKQISPLYSTTNSRYLQNLSQHPQYQYMCNTRARQLFQNFQVPGGYQSPQMLPQVYVPTPQPHTAPPPSTSSPRFLQNALQHPLLCRSISADNPHAIHHSIKKQGEQTKSPKKKNKSKKGNEELLFEPYITPEEVEAGLENNTLLEGVLRINPKQFQHAYVSSIDRNEQDVLLDGIKNRNRALEGDVVIVQYISDSDSEESTEETNKQKRGKVVFIKEKVHNRTCIGTLKLMPDKNRQKALFVPRDHRIPRLNIPFTSWPDNFYQDAKMYENTLFSAKIIEWFDTRFALGQIVCNIGQSGDMRTESKAILAQNDLDVTPFGPEVRHLFPRLDYTIPEDEISIREDCRKECIFSIDPFNCRDIDDAVSCKKLENGNYEIGVHISDVAHFLKENTLLDEKVAEKATTVYMVERAYHMLPDELCMLCSLFPGVDKLAFSVFWEITEDAKVLSHRFAKTVIHSCCQLAYDHAQAILDEKEDAKSNFPETYNGYSFKEIRNIVKILGKIAATFRRNRFEGGALRIDQPKVSFHLNAQNGLPETFWIYENKESHQLIEEFMLLANMTVATRIHDDHPKLAFLRCHPAPSGYMLRQLAKCLKPMGIELDITSAGNLHRSLLPYTTGENADRGRAMVLNMLCAKPMTRAKYFCVDGCEDDDYHHYALNVPLYTHFTSPIRRYADIMVHRLLSASLKYSDVPNWEVDKVRMIAAQCNKQKYNAKKAGEMSTELYTLKYIEMNSPVVTEAVVVEVREKYIDVIIVAMGLNRRIFFNNDFPGQYQCIKNDAGTKLSKMELIWTQTDKDPEVKQVIEVFSILNVEMHKGDDMVKVETRLVKPI